MVAQRRAKVRTVVPCRIVTNQPDWFAGLAALISSFGLPTRVLAPARALAEPVHEPGIDLLALEGEESSATTRELLARRHAAASPVVALVRRGRPRLVSSALALGCEDGIAFPLAEDELRLRLELHAGYALLIRELRLREQVCARWPEQARPAPTAASDPLEGDVVLVGAPSPIQVKLADALPLRRVVFVRSPRTAAARVVDDPPLLVVYASDRGPGPEAAAVEELVRAARRARVGCLLATPEDSIAALDARQLGFGDRIAAGDTPEELRLRLGFWLKLVHTRRGLALQRRRAAGGPAVDPVSGLWSRAMLLDYLNRREAYPAGRERACVVVRLGGLEQLAARLGHLAVEGMLGAAGERLARETRAEDLVAHLGDGVFCVVLPPSHEPEPEPLAARLREILARPAVLAGEPQTLAVAAVCGRLSRPADAPRTLERCVRDADPVLRRAA